MSNFVNYQIELTPSNAPLINQLNNLIITGEAPTGKTETKKTPKQVAKEQAKAVSEGPTLTVFKNAAKAAKKDHGEEFTMKVLSDQKVDVQTTLGRTMSKVDPAYYEDIMTLWTAGPQEDDGFDDEDDGFGDEADVDPEAVATALKAYSKSVGRDEAKELMLEAGAKKLSDVKDLDQSALAALLAKLI